MNTSSKKIAAAAGISAALLIVFVLASIEYSLPTDVQSECSQYTKEWLVRDATVAAYSMRDLAREARKDGRNVESFCLFATAYQKAQELPLPMLRRSLADELGDIYLEYGELTKAKEIFLGELEMLSTSNVVEQIERVEIFIDLYEVARIQRNIDDQRACLESARRESDGIEVGSFFRERLYLAEIQFFERQGDIDSAIASAQLLYLTRRDWNAGSAKNDDSTEAAKEEYLRLVGLRESK